MILIKYLRTVMPAILLIMVGITVYSNTFHVPFVLDDNRSIIQNEVIRSLENFYANGSGYHFLPNRFLAFLTFALNYHFGGLDVWGYHVVNLLIHLVSALLVYGLLRLTFRTPFFQALPVASGGGPGSGEAGGEDSSSPQLFLHTQPEFLIPFFAALLFVIHPVQTQAVTYVVQRITSLATMCYLLSLVLYAQARVGLEQRSTAGAGEGAGFVADGGTGSDSVSQPHSVPSPLRIFLYLLGSVLSAVAAMKTKEIAFTLPLAAVLYEACFFRGSWKRRLLYLLPLLATLPIIPLTVIDLGGAAGSLLSETSEQLRVQSGMSRLDYLFTQFRVIVTYLRLLILPINQNLDYDYPVYNTFFTPAVFLSFAVLLLLLGLAFYLWYLSGRGAASRKGSASGSGFGLEGGAGTGAVQSRPIIYSQPALFRLIAFGILWLFTTLAVESSVIPIVDVIMEHRLYLPSVGGVAAFSAAIGLVVGRIARPSGSRLLVLAAALLVLGFGFAAHQRNHVWGDHIRLWQDVVAKSPAKGRANNNLGVAFEKAGRRAEAVKFLSRAIAVDPGYYKAYYNLADLYLVDDQPDAALPLLQSAIKLNSDFTEAYVKLGAALMRAGRFHEVTIFLEQNLFRVKGNAEARFYLGAAHAFLGNRAAAMRELAVLSRLDAKQAASLAGLLGVR